MKDTWIGEAEETLRYELVRRGEEITFLNARLESTERNLRLALRKIQLLEDFVKRLGEISGDAH